jgi:hypothetical protein
MRGIALLLVLMLLVPAGAIAQEVTHSFAELNRQALIAAGEEIRITCDLGGDGEYQEVKVEFVGLSEAAITIEVDSLPRGQWERGQFTQTSSGWQVEVPESRVRQIVREYVSNAGTVGAVLCAAGGGSFGLLAGLASHDTEEAAFLGLVLGGAAGGVLGYFLFRSPGNDEVLYDSTQSTQAPFTFTLSPVISKDRKGALFTVAW